jgi:hypothetical protein
MMKQILLSAVVFGAAAFAASNRFEVHLTQDSVIGGKPIQAGVYELSMANGYAVFRQGRHSIEFPAHEETDATKANQTELLYNNKTELEGINLGGTNVAILFGAAASPGSGASESSSQR